MKKLIIGILLINAASAMAQDFCSHVVATRSEDCRPYYPVAECNLDGVKICISRTNDCVGPVISAGVWNRKKAWIATLDIGHDSQEGQPFSGNHYIAWDGSGHALLNPYKGEENKKFIQVINRKSGVRTEEFKYNKKEHSLTYTKSTNTGLFSSKEVSRIEDGNCIPL